jgi:integrating conjugative element protein (TIGR03757 family)
MPASLTLPLAPPVVSWRYAAAVLCIAWLSPVAIAADIIVVTDSHHPVQVAPQALAHTRVIELDLPTRIEAELAARLPADPDKAAALLRQRLHEGGDSLQQRLRHAYQDVIDARQLGIAKIPAVVVDRRHVVYGEPNVVRAIARIATHRSTQP